MEKRTTYFTPEFERLLTQIADLQEKMEETEDDSLFEELDTLLQKYRENFPKEFTNSLLLLMEAGLVEGCLHNEKDDSLAFSVNAIASPNVEEEDPMVILYGDQVTNFDGEPKNLLKDSLHQH